MSLQDQINGDIKKAMIAKDQATLAALRAIKSELLLIATSGSESNESEEVKMLQKMVKQRKDAAEVYTTQGREDLAGDERYQADVIGQYLPEQMSEEDIATEVQNIIEATGASGMQDMGKVMGMASGKLAGKAEGKLIAGIVKKLLSGQ